MFAGQWRLKQASTQLGSLTRAFAAHIHRVWTDSRHGVQIIIETTAFLQIYCKLVIFYFLDCLLNRRIKSFWQEKRIWLLSRTKFTPIKECQTFLHWYSSLIKTPQLTKRVLGSESNKSAIAWKLEDIQSRPKCSISLGSELFGVPYVEQGINRLLMRESSIFRKILKFKNSNL